MTFNIRYATERDSSDFWGFRKEQVVDLITSKNCDFVGIQEALPEQIAYLQDHLPQYGLTYRTREIDSTSGEAVPLLYLKSKWQADHLETYWLSSTPDIPGSNTWNAACNRVSTAGLFTASSGKHQIRVVNTHFDHVSQEARENGAKLILQRAELGDGKVPFVLLGDLNGKPDNTAIQVLTEELLDPYPLIFPADTSSGTFHGFKGNTSGRRIDYVLLHGVGEVLRYEILHDNIDGHYPSDHFPVLCEFKF